MENSDEIYMRRAIELGEQARKLDEVPVGAILVCHGQIIGEGINRRETAGRVAAHAEMEALEDYHRKLKQWRLPPETTVYVTVEPCLMCAGGLLGARVDRIVFGCFDTKNAALRQLLPSIEAGKYDHRFRSVDSGILEKECAEQISSYFREKRRQKEKDR